MGTTSKSGWALLWLFLGFTTLGTVAIGGGVFSTLAGIAMIIASVVSFRAARVKEEV